MKAIIPAAWYATRLYPLTESQPKALLDIWWKPMLLHCLEKIEELNDVDEVHIVTNNKFAPHFENWLPNYNWRLNLFVYNDGTLTNEDRLWAIGDIQFIIQEAQIDDDILIVACDNLLEDSLIDLYELFAKKQSPCISVYDIGNLDAAKQMWVVEVDEHGQVVSFVEKPSKPASTLISTMIYMIGRDHKDIFQRCIEQWKDDNAWQVIQELAELGDVYSLPLKWYWYDIGNKDQLDAARVVFG